MNTCHTAATALALAAWYLIVPAKFKDGRPVDAPVSEWRRLGTYGSLQACRIPEKKIHDDAFQHHYRSSEELAATPGEYVMCVSSDDPQLKVK
jgi:hypothetical protein